jgi:hypothetical protein
MGGGRGTADHQGAMGARARIAVEDAHPPQKQAKDGVPSVSGVKAKSKPGHPPPSRDTAACGVKYLDRSWSPS